mmetsp:Transcript_17362/g.24335  ORF Transcript_17362/g.24335 Transcript_17362/m.24335 type:complete len:328 (+) Transcript_17362:78-1061(+)
MALNCAMPRRPKLQPPRELGQLRQEHNKKKNIVTAFTEPATSISIRSLPARSVVMEMVSSIVDIVNADSLRPTNFSLLTPQEKVQVHSLVDMLISIKLTFVAKQEVFGYGSSATAYQLDPPIDSLLGFSSGLKFKSLAPETKDRWNKDPITAPEEDEFARVAFPMKFKQMLAKEVEFETVRRLEKAEVAPVASSLSSSLSPSSDPSAEDAGPQGVQSLKDLMFGVAKVAKEAAPADEPQPSSQQGKTFMQQRQDALLEKATAKGMEMIRADSNKKRTGTFLNEHAKLKKAAGGERILYNMHYSFNEGFTNAVKRPVPVSHFLFSTSN